MRNQMCARAQSSQAGNPERLKRPLPATGPGASLHRIDAAEITDDRAMRKLGDGARHLDHARARRRLSGA
jgi:hypothetical protein